MQYTLYGIKNCDTVKKAMATLTTAGIDFEFVDFKKTPPTKSQLQQWRQAFGDWPVNRRGRVFKQQQTAFEQANEAEKYQLLIEKTSMIKRPILQTADQVIAFGFDEASYTTLAASHGV